MDYEKKFILGDIVKGRRTFNDEIVEGKFNGFHLHDKLDPTSVVGVIDVESDRCYDVVVESIELESEDERIRKVLISRFNESGELDGISYDNIRIWLEKQCEQNSPILSNSLNIGKNEQKYANKVEPKFKVGDWIVRDDHLIIGKVISFDSICYWYNDVTCSCSVKQPLFFNDENRYHIWTIQDAKDGDILTSIGFQNNCTFIFNGLDNWKFDEPNGDRVVATGYCCLSASANKMEFGIQGPNCIEVNTIKPATKKQCELLFAKMKEAGYEWDADTKELKKIKQKPIWSEDDQKYYRSIRCYLNEFGNLLSTKNEEKSLLVYKACHWLESLKDRMQQPK